MAIADACREEYKAITDAGLIVQLDEPEFCTSWYFYPDWSIEEYRKYLELCVEVAQPRHRRLPVELIRFHTCWGSGHRPHANDIELKYVADLCSRSTPQQYSIEAANVRHEHEYHVWEDVKLPAGKMLCRASSATPPTSWSTRELVAERLVNYAKLVGKENVQTGTDCGIGSRVGHEEVVWAKLKAMSEGARIASKRSGAVSRVRRLGPTSDRRLAVGSGGVRSAKRSPVPLHTRQLIGAMPRSSNPAQRSHHQSGRRIRLQDGRVLYIVSQATNFRHKLSVQVAPSSALSRMRAFVSVRAAALPLLSSHSNSARSASVSLEPVDLHQP